jgi:hypothetical protein
MSTHRIRPGQTYSFCECESEACPHHEKQNHTGGCRSTEGLLDYRVASYRQTLCVTCALAAQQYCESQGEQIEEVRDDGTFSA